MPRTGARYAPSLMRPLVGITAIPRTLQTLYGEAEAHTATDALVANVVAAGGVPVLLPIVASEDARAQATPLRALVLAGGQDVDATSFGGQRHPRSTWLAPSRDAHELALLRAAVDLGLPVLGVCRGLQLANVCFGGDVVGHVDGHDAAGRHATDVHDVAVEPGSLLAAAVGGRASISVNTIHHQVVGRLASSLRTSGRSHDGLIEAAESGAGPWLLGVQWHPELMGDVPGGSDLFRALVAAAA